MAVYGCPAFQKKSQEVILSYPICDFKKRIATVFNFIFTLVTVSIISISYGLIAWYGFPYILGDCKESIQSYQGPQSNNVTFAIDRKMLTQELELTNDQTVRMLELELDELVGYKLIAGPSVECMHNDYCYTTMDICIEQTCQKSISPTDAACAKGFDCETREFCNEASQCVAVAHGRCGSKKDCPNGSYCDLISGSCEERVPYLNEFGFEYGKIFYNPICKFKLEDPDTSNLLHFYCEFIYEADAITHELWMDEDWGDKEWRNEDFLKNDNMKIECQLLHLQFRTFQIEMIDLQVLNGQMLDIVKMNILL